MCSSRLIFRENYVQPPDCIRAWEIGTRENSVWSSSRYVPVINTKNVVLICDRQVLVAQWIARWTSNPEPQVRIPPRMVILWFTVLIGTSSPSNRFFLGHKDRITEGKKLLTIFLFAPS